MLIIEATRPPGGRCQFLKHRDASFGPSSRVGTAGQLVESYLQRPIALRPFGTIEIFISQNDVRGGTGANFIIDWGAVGQIAEPVVEALMVGGIGAGYYAFISQGRPI